MLLPTSALYLLPRQRYNVYARATRQIVCRHLWLGCLGQHTCLFLFLVFFVDLFFFFTTCTSNWALTPISDNLVMILKLVYIKYIITIKLSSKALYEHFLAVCAVACRILQTKVRAERQHKPTLECPQCAVVTVTGIFGWEHRSEKIQTNTSKKRR